MAYSTNYNFPNYYTPNFPVYQPPQPAQSAPTISQASRLVSSKEEAVGVPADFAGNLMLFPDVMHNRIYLKKWNVQTGSADFVEFAPVTEVTEKNNNIAKIDYATKDDIKRLEVEIEKLKGKDTKDE